MNPLASRLLPFVGAFLLLATSALAEPAEHVTFAGSVRPLSDKAKATLHPMTAAHLGDSMGFNIPLALRNQAELEERVNRGEVIPGEELKAKYLPLPADYQTVAAWLAGEGFAVQEVGDAHLAVFARGSVAQIQQSFRTTLALITADGAERVVAQTAPSLPAAVAAPALGVNGLTYYRRQSRLLHPSATITDAVPSGGFHINDIVKAYSGAALVVNGTTLTGAGQTIGIEAYLFPKPADLTAFWTANGVTRTGTITDINVNNGTLVTDAGDLEETSLDVEWASGIAPGANIVVYATNVTSVSSGNDDAERIYARALSDAMVAGSTLHQFTSSYGPTEAALTSTELTAYNNYFLSMDAAGLTYLNASGDIGSGNGSLQPEAYGVFPYATGVGGTNLQVNTTTDVRTSEVGWTGSSGGISAQFARPTWQTGTGVVAGTKRLFPDLALAADNNNSPAYIYVSGKAVEIGGTSWNSPTFAGFLAMIHQGRTLNSPARGPIGQLNPRLYPLIGTANFFDVTSGSNGAYTAGAGYDMVTGVGVPTVSALLTTLLGSTITGFTPAIGGAGTSVIIAGTNFYGVTAVSFNGTAAASYTVNSATQITAVAPSGFTTGPITVTSFDPATSSTNFVLPAPDASIGVSHTGTFSQDDNGDTFTLSVSNVGAAATSGTVTVQVTPPTGTALVAVTGSGWACSGVASGWTCTRADALPASGSYPALTATLNIGPNCAANVAIVGQVTCASDSNSANNSFSDAFAVAQVTSTPTQQWRYQYFNTTANSAAAADTANPAGDGLPNLTKYALGLDPTRPEVSPVTEDSSSGYLSLTVPRNPSATDLTYAVQVTGDVSGGWTTGGTTVVTNTATTLTVHDNTPIGGATQRFIRLWISR